MKRYKLLSAVLGIIILGALLAGCPSDGSNQENNDSNTPPTDSNTNPAGPTVIPQQTRVVMAEMFGGDE